MSAAASDVSSDVHVIFPLIASASDSTHIALPHRKTECPCNHLQCLLLSHKTSQVPTTNANLAIPRRRLATKWLAWDARRAWSPDDADLRSLGIVNHSQFPAGPFHMPGPLSTQQAPRRDMQIRWHLHVTG